MAKIKQSLSTNPFSALQVFDCMEVGPATVEKRRLLAPYRLHIGGHVHESKLIYTFEEPVFDPDDIDSHNLADMIAAQVAINYGLFCRQILFRGDYDKVDQKFIIDMTENTSTEIYVKKILEHNPFLTGAAVNFPLIKQKKYTQAEILFEKTLTQKRPSWDVQSQRHTVLSSGGKDSLVSYAFLNESGFEVHPIFINESGRHWYTALNSYRYFRDHIANTARVWTNCDRVFNWTLRYMPFINQNYAHVRSDEYPLRLWTVAVFLFGALPLLRKRGIGRLVIGDEFDTTLLSNYHGIIHYNALYDQSRYFDEALSVYFQKKGYGIQQLSIIRPLSEMLIEKILSERYPHLLQQQTSCHATHLEGARVKPCGLCEKCRRIVCMLTALGSDPRVCEYSDEQIRFCLKELEQKDLHQESESMYHLLYLLHKKGVLQLNEKRLQQAVPHPEVLNVRFDPELSPISGLPVDLRKPLFDIWRKHALGFIEKSGDSWIPVNVSSDPRMKQ
jgi:hypothetical protein